MRGVQTPGEPQPFPSTIKPMLATLVDKPFSDPRWLFEPKLDGFRIMAFIQKGRSHPTHPQWERLHRSLPVGGAGPCGIH